MIADVTSTIVWVLIIGGGLGFIAYTVGAIWAANRFATKDDLEPVKRELEVMLKQARAWRDEL